MELMTKALWNVCDEVDGSQRSATFGKSMKSKLTLPFIAALILLNGCASGGYGIGIPDKGSPGSFRPDKWYAIE